MGSVLTFGRPGGFGGCFQEEYNAGFGTAALAMEAKAAQLG